MLEVLKLITAAIAVQIALVAIAHKIIQHRKK